MQNKLKRIFALICAFALLITTVLGNGAIRLAQAADTEPTPVTLDGYENVTIKDFSKDGTQMPEGEYPCTDATNGNNSPYSLTDGSSVDGKLLSMKVTFTKGGGSAERLDVAGSGEWKGFMVYPNNEGTYLYLVSNAYGTTDGWQHGEIKASDVGVSSFLNDEFILQLAFDFGTVGANNKADVTVKAYIDGNFAVEHVFTGCNMGNLGGYMSVYRQAEGAVVTVKSVEWPTSDVPISLDGYTNVTIKDFSKDGTQMPEGEYPCTDATNGNNSTYSLTDGSSVDGKLLSMKVTFTKGGGSAERLDVAGSGEWKGFMVYPNNEGTYLYLVSNAYGTTDGWQHGEIKASDVGVSSFLNDEFILQLAFDFGTVGTNNKADVTVKAYIDGNFAVEHVFTGCNMGNLGGYMSVYRQAEGAVVTVKSVSWSTEEEPDTPDEPAGVTPVQLEGFDNLTLKDFADADGNIMQAGEYEGSSAGAHHDYYVKDLANFDKKLLSMKVLYEGGEHKHSLIIGGNGGWCGFNLHPTSDGKSLVIDKTWGGSITSSETPTLSAETAGLTSFINEEFLLQLSFEYGEVTGGKADLTLGIYINGNLYNNQTFIIADCNMSAVGTHFAPYREVNNSSIFLDNVTFEEDTPDVITPIELEGFGNLTLKDFADADGNIMQAGEYEGSSAGAHHDYYVKDLANFDKKLLSMEVLYEGGEHKHSLIIGGNGGWCGFNLHPTSDGKSLVVDKTWGGSITSSETPTLSAETAGLTSFINEEFLLQVSFEYGEVTGGKADLTLGIYINGKLYNNQEFTIADCNMSAVGTHFAPYREVDGSSIFLDNVIIGEETEPDTPDNTLPDTPDESLNKVTFSHLGVADGTYNYVDGDLVVQGSLQGKESFDKTLFAGDMLLSGSGVYQLIFGGKSGGWDGLRLIVESADKINVYWYKGHDGQHLGTITSDNIGDFIGEEMNVMFSAELVDNDGDGNVNDIKVGLWINEVPCTEEYMIIANKGEELGNKFGVYCSGTADSVTIGSIAELTPQQPSEDLEKVTFSQYGIADGTYKYNGDLVVQGTLKDKDSVAGTVLIGDIELSESGHFQVILGGGDNAWNGIRFITDAADAMHVYWYEGTSGQHYTSFLSSVAGVDFQNEEFNLMISTELVDNDGDGNTNDIKLGVWFNGVLYDNEYVIISNRGDKLQNKFAAYCAGESSSVILASDPELKDEDTPVIPDEPQQPDESFEKITFAHFGVKDGTYKYNGDIVVRGMLKGKDTLDKTVLCGDILLDGNSSFQLIFGGKDDAWDGLRLILDNPDAMHLYWFGEAGGQYITSFTPIGAGVDFVGEEFNLMLSTEVVGDDIKVGAWFDGVLYGNQYITISGCADELGNRFAGYCSSEDASIVLNSIPELVPPVEPPKQPNENFEKITFEYFGVKDGTYKYDGTDAPTYEGKGNENLDQKVLCGDIRFSGTGENHLMVGGNGNTWYGLRFITQENGTIVLYWIDEEGLKLVEIFDPTTAGATLVGEWINLMISTEILDADGDGAKDDIELGVWFNGVLYQEQFYTILDKASGLGKQFGFDCAGEDNTISIRSIPELMKGFDFSVFGYTKDWQKTLLTDHKAETAVGGSRDPEPFTGDLLEIGKVCLFGTVAVAAIVAGIYAVLQRKKES